MTDTHNMFVSVANSDFDLARVIPALVAGRGLAPQRIFQVCTLFRQRGVAGMFCEGVPEGYHVNSMQSAAVFLHELPRIPEADKVMSFAQPLFDAISSGYWEAAAAMVAQAPKRANSDWEYEDDFLYVRFLSELLFAKASAERLGKLLERYELVLDGGFDVRLELCRALLAGDAEEFDEWLVALLEDRAVKVERQIALFAIVPDVARWIRHFSLEGLALLKIADRLGIPTDTDYLHCPEMLRPDSPFVFSPEAWRHQHYRPQRRADAA